MLLACASEAKAAGHSVEYVDLSIDPQDVKADLVVFNLFWLAHLETVAAIHKYCDGIPALAVAVPPGYAAQLQKLYPWIKVINAEPEQAMRHLPERPQDILTWEWDGMTPSQFDTLAPVDWSLVPRGYWRHYAVAVYQATRGCPYRCRFCVWGGSTVNDRTFKTRPAAQVADDIDRLQNTVTRHRGTGIPLYVLSSQLTCSAAWVQELYQATRGRVHPWMSNFNLRDVTAEKLDSLIESGMTTYSAGLEATTDEMLTLLGKPYTMEQARRGLAVAEAARRPYKLHILAGYGETGERVKEATRGLGTLGTLYASLNITQVALLPGTVLGDGFAGKRMAHPISHGFDAVADIPIREWTEFAREIVRLKMARKTSFKGIRLEKL